MFSACQTVKFTLAYERGENRFEGSMEITGKRVVSAK
jgi:hypothetical protein